MTISYKWLSEYLPEKVEPERLSKILTSVGLEVESMEKYEAVKGGLAGLVIGEVLEVEPHPNADKLRLTKVNIGSGEPLKIVCGAPNVAVGQKVVVATVGTTIYPSSGAPLTMKLAKIRGEESHGMLCAEDELGLGASHEGILVLPENLSPGTPAAEYFAPYNDIIYEIGLTPNRMDAMSHWGVARDVCAYLTHHDKKEFKAKIPNTNAFKADNDNSPIKIIIENIKACPRYSGISISGVKIGPSPKYMQDRLKAIGVRPINNVVDITNYILHETGQPLHAFDADKIEGKEVVVKNLPEGTPFITLDEKERKLEGTDLMICDGEKPMCIAGVFGGIGSGVTDETVNIFLESAFFEGIGIRKTSFAHGLRTDAAARFEKGTDISATVNVLKRAAMLIKEVGGGEISSSVIDVYPDPKDKLEIGLRFQYLKKLSGKNYHPDAVKNILAALGFELIKESVDELRISIPYHKTDVSLQADIVEEILRIDGLDNVVIPTAITITPSVEVNYLTDSYKEKTANYLAGLGFAEIMTNSITNEAYFTEEELTRAVRMQNSLSAEMNMLRPSMLETGLEAVAYNINRRNLSLRFFEFGKTYFADEQGNFQEPLHLCLYLTGNQNEDGWQYKAKANDFYAVKGVVEQSLAQLGLTADYYTEAVHSKLNGGLTAMLNNHSIVTLGSVDKAVLQKFGIKQVVYFAEINWDYVVKLAAQHKKVIKAIPRFPSVERDLAILIDKGTTYGEIEQVVKKAKIKQLTSVDLFDIFESEKIGTDKKSMAINMQFADADKTLTDKEIDKWMDKIIQALSAELNAEIRK